MLCIAVLRILYFGINGVARGELGEGLGGGGAEPGVPSPRALSSLLPHPTSCAGLPVGSGLWPLTDVARHLRLYDVYLHVGARDGSRVCTSATFLTSSSLPHAARFAPCLPVGILPPTSEPRGAFLSGTRSFLWLPSSHSAARTAGTIRGPA